MRVKYPRTFHLPWSESNSSDDCWWEDCTPFVGKEVVITEKMDGECTTMYTDHIHARSMDSGHHASRSWVKALHGQISGDIPKDFRICGENLFAFHSILYLDLPSYFLCFGVYDDSNFCLSWDETLEFCELLGLDTVPVLYRGIWDEETVKSLWTGKGTYPTLTTQKDMPESLEDFYPTTAEGYVVRLRERFRYSEFSKCVAKFVRANHVQTSSNWLTKPVFSNKLRDG